MRVKTSRMKQVTKKMEYKTGNKKKASSYLYLLPATQPSTSLDGRRASRAKGVNRLRKHVFVFSPPR